jgi:hypothetical protein
MSSVNQQTDLSISNFTNIFGAASNEYRSLTKNDLHTHPFAAVLDNCDSPDAVLNVFRRQAQAFDQFRNGDDRLMKWLDPTVHILFTFSNMLGEGIALVSVKHPLILYRYAQTCLSQPFPPAKTIFTGIGVLLGVRSSPSSSTCFRVTFVPDSKGRYRKPQKTRQPLRAYSNFPSTSQHLQGGPTDGRNDRTTREDYGTGAFDSCPFYEGDDPGPNQ